MKKVRVGLAGAGFAGHIHSRSLILVRGSRISNNVSLELTAVADSDLERAKQTANQYGWLHAVDGWEQLFEFDIDLLVVALPNGQHTKIIEAAKKAGITVLLEKPVTRTYEEARTLLDVCGDDPSVRVGYVNRFVPASQKAKDLIDQGLIGSIRNVRSVYLLNMRKPGGPNDWRFDETTAGYGASDDLGSHHIDLINFLAHDITGVYSDSRIWDIPAAPGATNDDAVNSLLELEGGAFGTLSASRTTPGHPLTGYVEIEGSHGALRIDRANLNELVHRDAGGTVSVMSARPSENLATLWAAPTVQGAHPFSWYDCFAFQMSEMVLIAAGLAPETTWSASLRDGVKAMAVTKAMNDSAEHHTFQAIDFPKL